MEMVFLTIIINTGERSRKHFCKKQRSMHLSENLSKQLTDLIQPLAQISGLELVDVDLRKENGRMILGIVIDREGGVSVDDCAILSRKISLALDVEDPLPFAYHLEVGSPGIFRTLKSEREIERNLQSRVKVVFTVPVSGYREFVGTLSRLQDRRVTIRGEGEELEAELQQIKKIQLFPEL